ncbi:PIN domain-containing protein [Rhabdaerophilum calidifontis]|uniref:PIN domain-containing protein n=1 Tax=Rhabdaerophilum calidifontis TaxID=2604328 RepID=UPI001407669D|nr:PIN domain-containing protein [Rhabdaerophilum calidifontis]
MPCLIDTCVLRELHLRRPYWRVRRAIDDLWLEDIHLSIVTFAIMEGGVLRLPEEFKQRRVRGWMREIRRKLGANLHGIDYETAILWGQIMTSAARRELRLPYPDGLIAATAKRHGLKVMTRNVGNFVPFGIEVFDPWADPKESGYDFGEEPASDTPEPGSTSAELAMPLEPGDAETAGLATATPAAA